jgi:hypothetical protein
MIKSIIKKEDIDFFSILKQLTIIKPTCKWKMTKWDVIFRLHYIHSLIASYIPQVNNSIPSSSNKYVYKYKIVKKKNIQLNTNSIQGNQYLYLRLSFGLQEIVLTLRLCPWNLKMGLIIPWPTSHKTAVWSPEADINFSPQLVHIKSKIALL